MWSSPKLVWSSHVYPTVVATASPNIMFRNPYASPNPDTGIDSGGHPHCPRSGAYSHCWKHPSSEPSHRPPQVYQADLDRSWPSIWCDSCKPRSAIMVSLPIHRRHGWDFRLWTLSCHSCASSIFQPPRWPTPPFVMRSRSDKSRWFALWSKEWADCVQWVHEICSMIVECGCMRNNNSSSDGMSIWPCQGVVISFWLVAVWRTRQ